MRKAFLVLAVFFAALSSESLSQKKPKPAESEDDVIRVNTTLVTVPVSVMDRQGRFIADLKESQFHLYENGVEQRMAFFESADKPFTVALMLDTSDSTRFKLQEIQDAARAFIDQLRPEDRVIIVGVEKQVSVLTEPTSDRHVLFDAVGRTQAGGGTALYSALELVVNQRLSKVQGRKAIVLFTDGVDTASAGATYEGTLRLAEELDALIYPIQFNTYDDLMTEAMVNQGLQVVTARGEPLSTAYERAGRYLHFLADKSGGRFFYATGVKNLKEVFASIAQELRQQYSIGYYPSGEAQKSERKIRVRVNAPNVVVRARRAFVYRQRGLFAPTTNYRLSAEMK